MVNSIKFLDLTLDNTLSWRPHIDTIAPKLSSAGFALRIVKPLLSPESLRIVYFSYFHSIMTSGIIFWGNSCHSNVIFRLQKRVIRIITGIRNRLLQRIFQDTQNITIAVTVYTVASTFCD